MRTVRYLAIPASAGYRLLLTALLALVAIGGFAAWYMEHNGHYVTGMNNQIIWGMPHVFAVFLIISASGALNVASIGSVFGKAEYKPLGRLSALLAFALLAGGLAALLLDLGRPDRLLVAMTTYNFKSIFAWNIYLYTGFFAIVAAYLWTLMDRTVAAYSKPVAMLAFIWRLILTTGTGAIFGFLVARQSYDAAILAPLFVVLSFATGMAIFILVLFAAYRWSGRPLGNNLIHLLRNLLGIFVAGAFYFTVVQHLTNLYATEHLATERMLLLDGGGVTLTFWIGQVLIGTALPLLLVYHRAWRESRRMLGLAAVAVIVGGLSTMYVIIIGGQAVPQVMFPGWEVSSSFYDGTFNSYAPSLPELGLGIGGTALALLLVTIVVRTLPVLPARLDDPPAE